MYIHVGMECSWRHMCVELGPRPCICALLWFLAWWNKVTDWWCGGISEGIRTCTCTHRTQYCRCGAYAFYLSIQIWSLTTKPDGRLLNDLALHVDWVNCVLYSPSGHHILSAGDNGIIKVRIKLITSDFYELIMYIIFGLFPDSVEWRRGWEWGVHKAEWTTYSALPPQIYCTFCKEFFGIWAYYCVLHSQRFKATGKYTSPLVIWEWY